MLNWLQENWMQTTTLAAAVFAAAGAIASAIIGWRQFRYLKQNNQRKLPVIHCRMTPIQPQANWRKLDIEINNCSEFGLDVLSATVIKPVRVRLRDITGTYESDKYGHAVLQNPLPEDTTSEIHVINGRRAPIHGKNNTTLALLAYNPSAGYPTDCSIRLTLRWRDESAKIFTIDAIITINDSTNVATV